MAVVINSDIYKQIDRLNKRLENIYKADKDFNTALLQEQYESVLRSAIPAEFLSRNKKGYLVISKSKKAQEILSSAALSRIETMQTAGEYKQELLQEVMEETGKDAEDVTIEEMRELSDDVQTVHDAQDRNGKINYNADDASFMQQSGTKSYHELAEVIRNYEKSLKEEKKKKKNKVVSKNDADHAANAKTIRATKARQRRSASDQVR